jgi:hypothetical protein
MDSSNCGKVCLISCLSCAALIVLFVLLMFIMACASCACMSSGFLGLFGAMGNVAKIQAHFDDLEAQGWDVDSSQSNQGAGYGSNVESGVPMIWRAREHADDEWTEYVWELAPIDPATGEIAQNFENMGWSQMMNLTWFLVPRTEAALEVQEELELPLPENFELQPWEEEGGRDRDRDRDEEEVRDRDHEGRNGDEEGGNGGEEERPRHGKSLRKAA